MKKIVSLLFFCFFFSLQSMEAERGDMKVKSMHMIKDLVEQRLIHNKEAGQKEKKMMVVGSLDLKEKETFSTSSFKELIKERSKASKPFILARATTTHENGTFNDSFYEAYGILEYLFGKDFLNPKMNRYDHSSSSFKPDPLTNLPVLGLITLYTINGLDDPRFEYLGSDYELHATEGVLRKRFVRNFLKAFNSRSSQSARAQNHLGVCFFSGRGVEEDYVKARELWEMVVNQGANEKVQSFALYNLGVSCSEGVDADFVRARNFFDRAAKQLVSKKVKALAEYELGEIYYLARGVEKDLARAKDYYQKAAQQTEDLEIQKEAKASLKNLEKELSA